jgi:hypothetical protein
MLTKGVFYEKKGMDIGSVVFNFFRRNAEHGYSNALL